MMQNLDRLYGPSFFKEWGSTHKRYVDSARLISSILVEEFRPRRMVDIGAGCGVYSWFLRQANVGVVSIDGVRPPEEFAYPLEIQLRDLTEPINNEWGEFDLTLCLEVAEHIPPEFTDIFLKNLTLFGPTLLLSAAPPGQGGHHHVNEQPKRYWVQKLAKLGFLYDRKRTGKLMEIFKQNKPGYMWMCEHISVYQSTGGKKINWGGLAFNG